jgi:hypothetical protein
VDDAAALHENNNDIERALETVATTPTDVRMSLLIVIPIPLSASANSLM